MHTLIENLAQGVVDYLVVKPTPTAVEHFHRVVTEFLDEWTRAHTVGMEAARMIADESSPRPRELMDLLQRNNVPQSGRDLLEMTTQAAASDLPPTHVGIHCGPVVFQDGDIYGRTVNIAARLSGHAGAGEILLSQQIANRLDSNGLTLQYAGMLKLKGVTEPLPAYRVRH